MSELSLATAALVAFGTTRRPEGKVDDDPTLQALIDAGTSTVCIVGKSWDFHVLNALGTDLDEGVAMAGESVRFFKEQGRRGLLRRRALLRRLQGSAEFTLRVLEAAAENGAELPGDV